MQAARGASLSPSEREVPVLRRRRVRATFLSVALVGYALDVLTKVLAVEFLANRAPVPLVGDLFRLTLVRNPGAAFSAGAEFTVVLSVLALVGVSVVLGFSRHLAGSVAWAVALGLLLAGIGGNLTDRLLRSPGPLRGHVIDFFQLPHWPVFNVADICIDVAAGLIILQAVRGIRVSGARADDEHEPPA